MRRRPATAADVDFLYAIREGGYRAHVERLFGPWIEEQQRHNLATDMVETPYEILEHDDERIGTIAVSHHAAHDFLEDLIIAPAHQGRGHGTRIMRELMAQARTRGVPLRLSVLDGNRVRELYTRLGFRVTHVVPPRTKFEWP